MTDDWEPGIGSFQIKADSDAQDAREEAERQMLATDDPVEQGRLAGLLILRDAFAVEAPVEPKVIVTPLDMPRLVWAIHMAEHPAMPDCRLGLTATGEGGEPVPWRGRRWCELKAERIANLYEGGE